MMGHVLLCTCCRYGVYRVWSYLLFIVQVFNESLFSLNMWLYSFFLKLLPCLVLTVLTACLIRELYKVKEEERKKEIVSLRML